MLLTQAEKDKYAVDYMSMVHALSYKYFGRIHIKMDIEDLEGAGYYGLTKALNTYDTEKDCKFSTYAFSCINNEIKYFLKKEFKDAKRVPVSLNESLGDDDTERIELLSDKTTDILKNLIKEENIEMMLECVKNLPYKYRFIIEHRYGLNDKKILTQEDIARFLGTSQAFVCKTEQKIINLLYIKMRELEHIRKVA